MKTIIIIPAFNEESSIVNVVNKVRAAGFHNIVVINDGSSDKTEMVALSTGAHVLTHGINRGQGAALQTGIEYALKENADIIVTFDADDQFDALEIKDVIKPIYSLESDIVKGSRFLGKKANMEWYRKYALKAAIQFTRITTGIKYTDVHNGFMAFSRDTASKLIINQDRMAHQSEIASKISKLKLRFSEVPVTVRYTDYSKNKGQNFLSYVRILFDMFVSKFDK